MGWFYVDTPTKPILNSIFSNWWGFRMPLFIFISGYLFSYLLNERGKYASVFDFIKKKFCRLIIPYFIFAWLMGLTNKDLTTENLFDGYAHLWFIFMLFWSFVLARLLACIKPVQKYASVQIGILFIALISSLLWRNSIDPFLYFNRVVEYFVWFWLGYVLLLHKTAFMRLTKYKYIMLFLCGYVICCLHTEFLCPKNNSPLGFKTGFWYDLMKALSYLFFILSAYLFINKIIIEKHFSAPQWVEKLNGYSYGIYIFHHWIIQYLFLHGFPYRQTTLNIATAHPYIFPLAMFVFVFIASFVLTKITLKFRIGRFLIG
jgi:fucose 4-O-acetylase-like acetyltransferase